jgi:hypothetical protein
VVSASDPSVEEPCLRPRLAAPTVTKLDLRGIAGGPSTSSPGLATAPRQPRIGRVRDCPGSWLVAGGGDGAALLYAERPAGSASFRAPAAGV